jgi:hypothetical protein
MRVLGTLCVIAALVLSTGGVAYRIKADPQPQAGGVASAATTAPADLDESEAQAEQSADPESCPADGGAAPKPVVIELEQLPPAKEFISLNGSGYNYSDPRRVPAVVPEQPSPQAETPQSSPPATPQDRD